MDLSIENKDENLKGYGRVNKKHSKSGILEEKLIRIKFYLMNSREFF